MVTGNETPFIVGITRDLTCTAVDILDVIRIEWKLVFAGFEPTLLSANNVNELTIQPTPFQIGQQMYKCVVTTRSGLRYSEDAMVTVQGKHKLNNYCTNTFKPFLKLTIVCNSVIIIFCDFN